MGFGPAGCPFARYSLPHLRSSQHPHRCPRNSPCCIGIPGWGPVTASVASFVRSYRDDRAIAIKAAEYLKHNNPHAEVAVRDRMTGDTITIKTPGRAR